MPPSRRRGLEGERFDTLERGPSCRGPSRSFAPESARNRDLPDHDMTDPLRTFDAIRGALDRLVPRDANAEASMLDRREMSPRHGLPDQTGRADIVRAHARRRHPAQRAICRPDVERTDSASPTGGRGLVCRQHRTDHRATASAVVGSITECTRPTTSAGKPPCLACSRTVCSSGAR